MDSFFYFYSKKSTGQYKVSFIVFDLRECHIWRQMEGGGGVGKLIGDSVGGRDAPINEWE